MNRGDVAMRGSPLRCVRTVATPIVAALLALAGLAGCTHVATDPPAAPAVRVSSATDAASAGLVDIRALVPDIDLDIRYAGTGNFTGTRIDGYDAPRCLLLRPAAEALARAERALRRESMRLRVFDCYRPRRAVAHFMRWAADPSDQRTKRVHYPNLDKASLVGDYISPTSGHSRGATVDLTLLECAARGRCRPLDMGTGFDLFDPLANTDSPRATSAQRGHRHRLRTAMQAAGFRNYPLEWWHYTLDPEPDPATAYDVPVR